MPRVDESLLRRLEVMAITTRNGQSGASSSGSAMASLPSSRCPRCIRTKPPNIERAAEPEPRRASSLSVALSNCVCSAASAAHTRAAKPDADEASPAAVGKSLSLSTLAAPPRPARARMRSSSALTRALSTGDARSPSRKTWSGPGLESKAIRVRLRRSLSVIESESTAGVLRSASRLPQYLISAMLGWACAVAAHRE